MKGTVPFVLLIMGRNGSAPGGAVPGAYQIYSIKLYSRL